MLAVSVSHRSSIQNEVNILFGEDNSTQIPPICVIAVPFETYGFYHLLSLLEGNPPLNIFWFENSPFPFDINRFQHYDKTLLNGNKKIHTKYAFLETLNVPFITKTCPCNEVNIIFLFLL